MKQVLFAIVIASFMISAASLLLSILKPELRTWPPPSRNSWQFLYHGIINYTGLFGLLVLGLFDWNSFIIDLWARYVIGGLLVVSGGAFSLWGFITLGVHASQGLGGELVRNGPYRFSRNPQYVGMVPVFFGYAILCNSELALIVGLLASACFLLTPFAEEPWLRDWLGASYEEYAAKVPRYFALRSALGGWPRWKRS